MTLFPEDIIQMTPAEREKAIEKMMADGHSRESAEEMLELATGESDGDLDVPAAQRRSDTA